MPPWRHCDTARPPPLAAGQVHAWLFPCGPPHGEDASALSAAEVARANAFRTAVLRDRFVAAHAGLRCILSGYAGIPAQDLCFRTGRWGKPYLDGPASRLKFNLSHSEDHALLAVQRDGEVGADIQDMQGLAPFDAAGLVCSPGELAALNNDPAGMTEAFFAMWTRKEALAKAMGTGLVGDLTRFDVCTGAPGKSGFRVVGAWRVGSIRTIQGYAAAIATGITAPALLPLKPMPITGTAELST